MLTEEQLKIADRWIAENVNFNELAFEEIVEEENAVKYLFYKDAKCITFCVVFEGDKFTVEKIVCTD